MVLVISGFDPSAGAGMLQDIKSLSLLGITAIGVVSAYTVQNTEKVFLAKFRKWEEIDLELTALPKPNYIKIGLISPEMVKLVREKYPDALIIWNIVLKASSGYEFEQREIVREHLDYADYVVLNNKEAEELGVKPSEKFIITNGHTEGEYIKVTWGANEYFTKRIVTDKGSSFHGTGCAFSSLLTGFLSFKYPVPEAIRSAMEIMTKILERSTEIQQVQSEKLAREWMKYDVLSQLENIKPEIEKIGYLTVPEVGQNVSFALPWSEKEEQVAKFPGRIRLKEGRPAFVSDASFKDKSHTARMTIAIKSFFPHIRCVSNVRYSEQYIQNAINKGLKVFKYDRSLEPESVSQEDGSSMQWMIKYAVEKVGQCPDIIYDDGWYGKEAMIRVFGRNPREVIEKIKKIIS
ncbi:MAG: thiamine-phosphate synthase family protein [Fervidobacterium sp.]